MHYEVFNGDADGICALHQLRLAQPIADSELVTGVKRDIRLLRRLVDRIEAGDSVRVLDISMDSNKEELRTILERGAKVFYADHHFAGEIPAAPTLVAHIDPRPDVCTSLIVDKILEGRFRGWAVAAAFGDNLHDAAHKAAADLALNEKGIGQLRELGELINYNGYGGSLEDLHYTPQELYRALQPYEDPFVFIEESEALPRLRDGFADDMLRARQSPMEDAGSVGRIFFFPAAAWSKRVAGVYSNERAREKPDMAHALLVDNGNGTFMISVRAPLNRKKGADDLCRQFPTGGGRSAAAGVNALPADLMDTFLQTFEEVFSP